MYPAKYQHLNVPSIPLHVIDRQPFWSFHFLRITLPQWLVSSFRAKGLSFKKKQVLCIISQKYSTHEWEFLMITVRDFWLIWQCPFLMKSSKSGVQHLHVFSKCLFFIAPTVSHSYLKTSSSGTAATSSFTYLSHTLLHKCKHNRLRCGKCEGTSANHPLPTNTR